MQIVEKRTVGLFYTPGHGTSPYKLRIQNESEAAVTFAGSAGVKANVPSRLNADIDPCTQLYLPLERPGISWACRAGRRLSSGERSIHFVTTLDGIAFSYRFAGHRRAYVRKAVRYRNLLLSAV